MDRQPGEEADQGDSREARRAAPAGRVYRREIDCAPSPRWPEPRRAGERGFDERHPSTRPAD